MLKIKEGSYSQGFTLIELLIVIAIIAILSAVVFVALDPGERFKQTRDSERLEEIRNIAEAVKLYQIDNDGDLLCEGDSENGVPGYDTELDAALETYFGDDPPIDPSYSTEDETYRYYIDNYACCKLDSDPTTTYCEQGGVFISKFESEQYQNEYDNYDMLCPEGYTYGGEASYDKSPYAYVIPFQPSCWN